MRTRRWCLGVVVCAAAMLALAAGPARGQIQTGEIFGNVTDNTGAVLPGVVVTLDSPALIRPLSAVTSGTGAYRFPALPTGVYRVRFDLVGFKVLVQEGVQITAGFNAEINPRLELTSVEETITVSSESPVVDTREVKSGQTFTRLMLEGIPSARDPWVILEQTPGVVMDRQNVGGSQSGQQSSFTVHGGNTGNTMWNIDGVTVTDMAATGASPAYYDFDAFEEIQIQTAGNDASLQTGGINLNLITKSGGNRLRGSGRVFLVDDAMQANNVTRALFDDGADSGNPIQEIRDYGVEVGGPIVRNKAWFWGGYGKQDIRVGVLGFYRDEPACQPPPATYEQLDRLIGCLATDLTVLENYNGKLQYQPANAHKLTALYTRGDKIRNARGASPTTRIESTFRQSGPTDLYKGAHQWIASDRMTVETQFAYTAGGFVLDFHRDDLADVQRLFDLETGVTSRSGSRAGPFDRPQKELKSDAHYLLSGVLGGDHSMKFGVRWRDTPYSSEGHIGGNATARVDAGVPVEADLHRDSHSRAAMSNLSAYANNSYSRGRVRLNVGLRVDHQDDEALPSTIPANPIVPDLLPAIEFAGVDSGVTYTDWSPRLGVTYDVRGNGKTVAKASTAVYYGQGIFTQGTLNPVGATTLRYRWNDANGDLFVQRAELDLSRLLSFSSNYNPANPGSLSTPNAVDPDLRNDRTREVIAGVEHEILPGFGVAVNYIWRRYDRFSRTDRVGVSAADYLPVTQTFACGNQSCAQGSYTVTYYRLPFRLPAAQLLTGNPYYRDYNGLELSARKRYRHRWMMNGSLVYGSTVAHYPDGSYDDPTNVAFLDGAQENSRNARWVAKLSGLYALPWQVNLSAFVNLREGFPLYRTIRSPDRGNGIGRVNVTYEPYGTTRFATLATLDARVEKAWLVRSVRTIVSLDLFNVTNSNVVLDREGRQNVSAANRVFEILAPRVARLGVRFSF